MIPSSLKKKLPYLLALLIIGGFGLYLGQNFERYQRLFQLSPWVLLGMALLSVGQIINNGLINLSLYRALGVTLRLNEGIGLAAVNTLANQLPFAAGMVAKGVYLKQRHGLAYSMYLSATLPLFVCFLATNGLVGLLILSYWHWVAGMALPPVLFLAFLGMSSSLLILWLPPGPTETGGPWRQRLNKLLSGWRVLSGNYALVGQQVGLQLVLIMIYAGRIWFAFYSLSQTLSLMVCILFAAATILTRLVNVTPGALGVREAIVASIGVLLGFDPGISAVAIGFDRLVSLVVIVLMGSIYSQILGRYVLEES